MSECLREVAGWRTGREFKLFTIKSDIVGEPQEFFESPVRFLDPPGARQIVDGPKGTDTEGAFGRVARIISCGISPQESALAELMVDQIKGAAHLWIGRREIPVMRH